MKNESKALLDEYPLLVLPKLATVIGLNEAIILQQIHYWLLQSGKEKDGRTWIFNTYDDWKKQFPFFSLSTIKRTIKKLEKSGLLITGNYNKLKIDQTKWYTIDHNALDKRIVHFEQACKTPIVQNEQNNRSNCTKQSVSVNNPLPETTSEITSEIKKDKASSQGADGVLIVDNLTAKSKIIYQYFMNKYITYKKEVHPTINMDATNRLNDIIENEGFMDEDLGRDCYLESDGLVDMIDLYFKTSYPLDNGECADHRIWHFLSSGVLKNLYYKAMY